MRSQLWFDLAGIAGGGLAGTLWYYYSRVRVSLERVDDLQGGMLIALLPVCICVLRKPLDLLLQPLQSLRQRLPPILIVVAGLAVPFLVANFMYEKTFFGTRMIEFPYARAVILVSTVLSYLVLRTPAGSKYSSMASIARGGGGSGGVSGFIVSLFLSGWLPRLIILLALFPDAIAYADHYLKDPLNLNDGLRTGGGAAQTLAGTAAVIVAIAINGAEIARTLVKPAQPTEDGQTEEATEYRLEIRTEDRREDVAADGLDRLCIYANVVCNKPEISTAEMTDSIQFAKEGINVEWLKLGEPQMVGGCKSISVRAEPPFPDAELTDDTATIRVSAFIAGGVRGGPVRLKLLYYQVVFDAPTTA
jgi:hypothetical protein